ncbi:MAG: glycine radical domain-containing protein, partial [Promethearchaeota archaeon]
KKNYRGGKYNPGYWSMTIHSGFGKLSWASPHGRMKGEPFTSGLTPVSFAQKNGPTAVFNSLAYLDSTKMPNGMALNMKFSKSLFKNRDKIEIFKSMFKTYFKKGGMQVQFTIHDAQTLIDAKNHPEKYPDLMVRISGYTAYFNDLNEHMKEEIIKRALMDF